jgi:DNA-directed RNA polymerase subunit RPC12/RpoP
VTDDRATCHKCGARVLLSFLPEHLCEHFPNTTADEVRNAPIIDETVMATEYPPCPACGERAGHIIGCPEMDKPR